MSSVQSCSAILASSCGPAICLKVPPSLLLPQVQPQPFVHTPEIPRPQLQNPLPPAQSDLYLKDVLVIQVLTARQAAITDPATGPCWTLSSPDPLPVLAQASIASSNSISHKPLDCLKAAVEEGLPHGSHSQTGTTTHSGGQAQPAPASSRLNPLAVPWDPVLGLSRASPDVYSSAHTLAAPTSGHLSSGARAVSPSPGYPHITPQWPHHNVAAGSDLDTSESGTSDDEDESSAHLRPASILQDVLRNLSRSSGARAVPPPPGLEHITPHPKPERPRCHISEKGKRRSKARALKKKEARRQARLLREQQMQSAGT